MHKTISLDSIVLYLMPSLISVGLLLEMERDYMLSVCVCVCVCVCACVRAHVNE